MPNRSPLPYLPYPHLMGLAPLDVWYRLLRRPPASVPLRYWPRLAVALGTSALATVLTLPERALWAAWWSAARRQPHPLADPVILLGHYRSGTTHLHYLLACDPALYSPAWVQALAPQGFVLSWTVLRLFLLPFMPATRPVDNLPFGPDVPAEDDFALANWALVSTLPGRAVLPRARGRYDRFHDLRALSAAERGCWRHTLLAFTHKLAPLARGRRLLLKTPSHTARVEALLELFPGARFIHIRRQPQAVLRSNLTMADVLHRRYHLQDAPPLEETALLLAHEYAASEQRYLETRHLIPAGQLAEIRFDDLLADPGAEIRRAYAALDLRFTPAFERALEAHLHALRDYAPNVHAPWAEALAQRCAPILAPLAAWNDTEVGRSRTCADRQPATGDAPAGMPAPHHVRPGAQRDGAEQTSSDGPPATSARRPATRDGRHGTSASRPATSDARLATHARRPATRNARSTTGDGRPATGDARRATHGIATAALTALVCAALWLAIAQGAHNRFDSFVWPAGLAIGFAGRRTAGAPDRRLAVWFLVLTLLTLLAVATANTRLLDFAGAPAVAWGDLILPTACRLTNEAQLFWSFMGLASAHRLGRRF